MENRDHLPVEPEAALAATEPVEGVGSIDPSKLTPTQTRVLVLELKKRGLSFREIGVVIGKSHKQAHRYYKQGVKNDLLGQTQETEERRQLELAHLEGMRLALYPRIKSGDVNAIQTALRIQERISLLTGINSPVLIETKSVVRQQVDEEQLAEIARAFADGKQG